MTTACSCNYGLGNSKSIGCQPIMSVTHGLIFVPTYTSTGTLNKINLSSAQLDQAEFEALTANASRYLRWRPVVSQPFEEVELTRADSKYDSYPSGRSYFVHSGPKTFKAKLIKAGPGMINFFDSARCEQVSVYIVDINGALVGNTSEAGYLRPFKILKESIDAIQMNATDDKSASCVLRFEFDSTEEDSDVGLIEANEMSYDVKLLTGLYDVKAVFSSITSTGFVADIRTFYGTALNPNRVTGMLVGDFTLHNRATGVAITITSVTESTITPGVYTFVIPTNATKLLKLNATLTGYDFNIMSTQILETPA